jgi:hypothetical protein
MQTRRSDQRELRVEHVAIGQIDRGRERKYPEALISRTALTALSLIVNLPSGPVMAWRSPLMMIAASMGLASRSVGRCR